MFPHTTHVETVTVPIVGGVIGQQLESLLYGLENCCPIFPNN